MAILDIKKTEPNDITEDTPTTTTNYRTQEEMSTSIIFNKDTSIESIVKEVDGMPWGLNAWFSQIRDTQDEPRMPDINVSESILKYNRIDKVIVFTDSGLDENLSGQFIVNSGFIPSYGDVFLATVAGNREAIFVVTVVTKKTYSLQTIYEVEFNLHSFMDTDVIFYNDLLYKTVNTYIYDKDHLVDRSAPLILKSSYKKKIEFKTQSGKLMDHYLKLFISKEKNLLSPPAVSVMVDTLLLEFLYKLNGRSSHPKLQNINSIDVTRDHGITTIWDVLLNQDITLLDIVTPNIAFARSLANTGVIKTRTPSVLGVDYITREVDDTEIPRYGYTEIPTTPHVLGMTHYVFSSNFYDRVVTSMSDIEQLTYSYLNKELLDKDKLTTVLLEYNTWSDLHKYYLMPVLMLLTKYVVLNTYSSV